MPIHHTGVEEGAAMRARRGRPRPPAAAATRHSLKIRGRHGCAARVVEVEGEAEFVEQYKAIQET